MVQAGVRKILNDVIDGKSILDYLNIETVANVYPGAVVKRDTTDYDIEVCGAAGDAIGFVGYGDCVGNNKPATRDTIYEVGAEAPVHSGGGFRVRGIVASEAFTKGDPIVAAADGKLTKATEITIVASGAASITDGQAVTGSYGAQGPVIARAAETVADTVTRLWVTSYI